MSAPQLRSKQEKATDGDDEHERIDVKAAVKNMQDAGMPLRRIHELLGIEPAKAPEVKEPEHEEEDDDELEEEVSDDFADIEPDVQDLITSGVVPRVYAKSIGEDATVRRDLPSELLKGMKTDLKEGTVKAWLRMELPTITRNVRNIVPLYDLDLSEFAAIRRNIEQVAIDDEYAARMILACLDPQAIKVKELKAEIVEIMEEEEGDEDKMDDLIPTPNVSGYRLIELIRASENPKNGARAELRIQAFEGAKYFKMGMTYAAFDLAVKQMFADWRTLPEDADGRTGRHAKLKLLLKKMPPDAADESNKIWRKILEKEAMGEPQKYTVKSLAAKLSVLVCGNDLAITGNAKTSQGGPPLKPPPKPGRDNKNDGKSRSCGACGSKDHWASEKGPDGKLLCKRPPCASCKKRICPLTSACHKTKPQVCLASWGSNPPPREDVRDWFDASYTEGAYSYALKVAKGHDRVVPHPGAGARAEGRRPLQVG